jgi:hypothetical protein
MKQYEIIENSYVLMPNSKHRNFNITTELISRGTLINGNETFIQGIRKGQDFTYKLLEIAPAKYIFLKNVKPISKENIMETREVTLGADANVATTVVKVPSNKNKFVLPVILGSAAGLFMAFKMNKSMTNKIIFTLAGAGTGYLAAKFLLPEKDTKVAQVATK